MIISHAHRFVVYHNPKTAGMSLRAALLPYHDDPRPAYGVLETPWFDYPLDFAHLRLHEIQRLFPSLIGSMRAYRSVIVVRNPYKRFISAVDQHLKTVYAHVPLEDAPPHERTLAIETFIERVFRVELVQKDFRFVHLSPQVWFLRHEQFRLPTNVVPFDEDGVFLERCFALLGVPPQPDMHDNKSKLDLRHVFQSRKITDFVQDFYAKDFEFLAADPTLAHLVAGPSDPDWLVHERPAAGVSAISTGGRGSVAGHGNSGAGDGRVPDA